MFQAEAVKKHTELVEKTLASVESLLERNNGGEGYFVGDAVSGVMESESIRVA